MKINSIEITSKEFAYDGCHKIYLIETEANKEEAISCEYKILPIEKLKDTYFNSCGLEFINTWALKTIVGQSQRAIFE